VKERVLSADVTAIKVFTVAVAVAVLVMEQRYQPFPTGMIEAVGLFIKVPTVPAVKF